MTERLIRVLAPPQLATWLAQAYLRRVIVTCRERGGADFSIRRDAPGGGPWRASVRTSEGDTVVIEVGVRPLPGRLPPAATEVWVSPQGVLLARGGDRLESGWIEVETPSFASSG